MTVDARQTNGFPDDAQWLIHRFAELADLGIMIWAAKAEATAGLSDHNLSADDRL